MNATEILEGAYRDLDWLQPLQPDDPKLTKELFGNFLRDVARELILLKGRPRTILLHGHVGCGKSTFLNCLQVDDGLNTHFVPVPVFIKEVCDPQDVDAIDLYLGMTTAALAVDLPVPLYPKDVTGVVELYRELKGLVTIEETREDGRKAEAGAEAGVGIPSILSWLKASFQLNYKVSVDVRSKVRETYRPRVGTLIERANQTFEAVEARLGHDRHLLFLVHDTDKPSIDRSLRLFDEQAHQLSQLGVPAVFVVDKSLACSGRFSGITTRLGTARPFPGLKITESDGESSEKTTGNRKLVEAFLTRRLPGDSVTTEALGELIEIGGGHCRETLRVAREATLKAILRESPKVDVVDVEYAAIERANEFSLTREDWNLLAEILKDPRWCPPTADAAVDAPQSAFLRLLNNVAVLEYTNGEAKWLRPHTVLIGRLKRLAG